MDGTKRVGLINYEVYRQAEESRWHDELIRAVAAGAGLRI